MTVQLTPIGSASVGQGSTFRFRAVAANADAGTADLHIVFRLVAPASAGAVDTTQWNVSIPGNSSASTRGSLVTSQWFAEVGVFEIHALIAGADAGAALPFTVSAPTQVVPTFQDVTQSSGLVTSIGGSLCGAYAAGAAWGDVNGDGALDLYVPRGSDPAQLFVNDGSGHFTDQAAARGVQDLGVLGIGAVFVDYDNDGDQDLFVADNPVALVGPDRLYNNDGTGHFRDVAAAAGIAGNSADVSAAWGDYDGDGFLDLYVVSNSPCLPPIMYESDHLWHNNGDGTFTDQTALLAGADGNGAGYQAAWFDYDGDGDQDLYLANDRWGPDPDANHLWRNDGSGPGGSWTFTDVSGSTGTGYVMNSMGIGIGDPDRDLDLDFAISNIGGNVLARNEGDGSFTDIALPAGVQRPLEQAALKAVTWGLAFADLNLDGWEDLFVAGGDIYDRPTHPNEVYTNAGDGTFLDLSALSGAADFASGRGVALADVDRDGLMDVFVINRAGQSVFYRNVTAASGHWLGLHLTGTVSNRDACGARVLVSAAGGRQLREVFCGSVGLSSGSDTDLHVGLGTATSATKVTVTWPSGRRQVVRNVAADQLVNITEPTH